jgi:nitrous oxide reductase accessory protein NosL
MSGLAAFAVVVAIFAAGCSGASRQPVPGPRQLTDLRDIGQLRSLFNSRSGEPRLIVLVSPT